MQRGIPVYLVFIVAIALLCGATIAGAGTLVAWPWGFYFVLINVVAVVTQMIVAAFSRPQLLRRRLTGEHWWQNAMVPLMALGAAGSAFVSAADVRRWQISPLPAWTLLLSVILLISAYLINAQSLQAKPPHGEDRYGEESGTEAQRGPYEAVRHPIMLSVLLASLAIPLFLGSGIGFAPLAVTILGLVLYVNAEDNWRFEEYEWFFDYTNEVPYRLIPFLW